MKRIIKCPKCEAKLAVFDIGKPINQKCPKCGNAFVVESEEKAAGAKSPSPVEVPQQTVETAPAPADEVGASDPASKKDVAAVPVQTGPEKAEDKKNGKTKTASVSENPAPASAVSAAASTPVAEKKDGEGKEIKLKKPQESPVSVSKPRAPVKDLSPETDLPDGPLPSAGGSPFLFSAVVMGFLLLLIILQVMAKMQSNKQYGKIIEHLQYIETKLAK